jgi:hypothetical protein
MSPSSWVWVDGDEVGDAVLGGERGGHGLRAAVGIREPVEGYYLSEVAPVADHAHCARPNCCGQRSSFIRLMGCLTGRFLLG